MRTLPKLGTQEAHVLAFLMDGFTHTVWDRGWPDGPYTGRNAVSRLKAKGWPIESWKPKGEDFQRYRLVLGPVQGELAIAGGKAVADAEKSDRAVRHPSGDCHGAHAAQACACGSDERSGVIP